MQELSISLCTSEQLSLLVNYLTDSEPEYLESMGFAPEKIPPKDQFMAFIHADFAKPEEERIWNFLIWNRDGNPIGYSILDNFTRGAEGHIHAHIFKAEDRLQGYGRFFVKESLDHYFKKFQLQTIIADSVVANGPANRLLENLGFDFEKVHLHPATMITNEVLVKRWKITPDQIHES